MLLEKVCDISRQQWDRDCQLNNHISINFWSLATERELGKGLFKRVYGYTKWKRVQKLFKH